MIMARSVGMIMITARSVGWHIFTVLFKNIEWYSMSLRFSVSIGWRWRWKWRYWFPCPFFLRSYDLNLILVYIVSKVKMNWVIISTLGRRGCTRRHRCLRRRSLYWWNRRGCVLEKTDMGLDNFFLGRSGSTRCFRERRRLISFLGQYFSWKVTNDNLKRQKVLWNQVTEYVTYCSRLYQTSI